MRQINDHKVGTLNEALEISVLDEPGQGGASHEYTIRLVPPETPDGLPAAAYANKADLRINFQNGPVKEMGFNGITQEALLAVVIDRLRSFQAGPYASEENASALIHCESALSALKARTLARISRGVEGTNQK